MANPRHNDTAGISAILRMLGIITLADMRDCRLNKRIKYKISNNLNGTLLSLVYIFSNIVGNIRVYQA